MGILNEHRLLKVTTPLGEDFFYLTALSGREAFSEPFDFTLSLGSDHADVNPDALLGKPISIHLQQKQSTRIFHGIVYTFESQGINQQGYSTYQITVGPWLNLLKTLPDSRIFQHQSVIDIFKSTCARYGLSDLDVSNLQNTYSPLAYCTQYQETDFEFIQRILANHGIYYYFQYTQQKHTMVLLDKNNATLPTNTIPFSTTPIPEEHVHTLEAITSVHSTQVNSKQHDYLIPADPLPFSASTLSNTIAGVGQFSRFHYPAKSLSKIEAARQMTQQMNAWMVNSVLQRGASNVISLAPNDKITIDTRQANPHCFLTAVRHEAEDQSHTVGAAPEDSQFYRNQFESIPLGTPYAPFLIEKPAMMGVYAATVVGEADSEQPFVDQYGRIKVHFQWDHHCSNLPNASCWIRVAQKWAGKDHGVQFIPRVESQVLISFMDGDPDQPVMLGSLYQNSNKPPYSLPENQASSGVNTQTLKTSTASHNQLQWVDNKGEELFLIQAEKDFSLSAQQNETVLVNQDFTLKTQALTRMVTGKHTVASPNGITLIGGSSEITLTPGMLKITAPVFKANPG